MGQGEGGCPCSPAGMENYLTGINLFSPSIMLFFFLISLSFLFWAGMVDIWWISLAGKFVDGGGWVNLDEGTLCHLFQLGRFIRNRTARLWKE